MFEQVPQQQSRGILPTLGGVLVGVFLGFVIPIVVFFVANAVTRGDRVALAVSEIVDLTLLAFIGRSAYKNMANSALNRGLLIGISITFLLNAICGIAMLGVR
jgi:hypothetical protein